jgi:TolB-like protein/tetratricopeptide (TPR) repeat protein
LTLTAGTRLGSYEIVAPLGAGGMGQVYRARDKKLDRDVAVKVLPESVAADPDSLSRFEREAKAVAALSHPNILAIHDFGTQNGTTYAVTELLEGDTLRGRIDSGAVSQKQALDWSLQIAKGLSAAHGKGVVHRDLKPDNVFVCSDGHVKILDFGLAKRVGVVGQDEQTMDQAGSGHTEPGTVMGTMGYMSPEQLRGLPVDHRSDIFSFGTILYELLSGRKAFKKDTASDTIAAVLREEPAELTQSGRNVSPALDHIVRHCLEKDRENRFQTAKDVAFALSEASAPTTAVTSGVHVVRAEPKAPWKKLAIAGIALVVLAAAGLLLWKRPRIGGQSAAGGARRVAVLPFENLGAPEDDYFADGIADQVRGKLTSLPGVVVIARGSSTPYRKTTKTPQEIARELSANYLLTATVRWEKGGGQNRVQVNPELVEIVSDGPPQSKWQQPFDASLTDVFQVQSDIATKVAQALGTTLGAGEQRQLAEKPTQNLAAYDAYLKGEQVSGAMTNTDPPTLRKSLGLYEQAVALDPGFAEGWARVSVASSLLYRNGVPTPELADRSLKAAEKSLSLAPNRPEPYHALGNYQRLVKQDYAAAREQYAKGLRLAPNDINNLGSAVGAEQSSGMWDAALEHARAAERLDPRSLGTARRVGLALIPLRRYAEARQALDRALAISPSNLLAILSKTMAFLGEGNLAGARAFLETSTRSVEPTALVAFVANYQDLGWVLTEEQQQLLLRLTPDAFDGDRTAWAICLTQGYALKGDVANVRVHAEEARKANEEQLRDAPNDAQRRAFLGLSLAYLGRKDEAIREGLRAVEMQPISSDAVNGPYLQHQLARIYILTGEPEKAIDRIETFLKVPYFVSTAWLKIDPNFDPLRSNPRFQKLVAGAK